MVHAFWVVVSPPCLPCHCVLSNQHNNSVLYVLLDVGISLGQGFPPVSSNATTSVQVATPSSQNSLTTTALRTVHLLPITAYSWRITFSFRCRLQTRSDAGAKLCCIALRIASSSSSEPSVNVAERRSRPDSLVIMNEASYCRPVRPLRTVRPAGFICQLNSIMIWLPLTNIITLWFLLIGFRYPSGWL